jgi:hypothetical protein
MIQFNLLPDVKMEYIKAQRAQRLVWVTAIMATSASVTLLVLLLGLNGLQKKHMSDLSKDIGHRSSQLKGSKDIGKILTVQNQLESLTSLHEAKPAMTRLFDYLNQVTPANISINNFTVDLTAQTAVITGGADSLSSINQYVDSLKFTSYKADDGSGAAAFGNIVLTSWGLNSTQSQSQKAASYTISLNYDPKIFDITTPVKLTVPKQTTTRSEVNTPPDLFQAVPVSSTASGSSTSPSTSTGSGSH